MLVIRPPRFDIKCKSPAAVWLRGSCFIQSAKSDNALAHHSGGNLLKAGNVGTSHEVALHAVALSGIGGILVDIDHDAVQALVALGYGSTEALKAVKKVEITEVSTVEDVLKQALKYMMF